MLVNAHRIVRSRFARSAFDGEGARAFGGRWSSPGIAVVYVSSSVPLAMLEVVVHLPAPRLLEDYVLISLRIPERLIEALAPRRLPKDWRESPPPPDAQRIGDDWVASGRYAVLRVPSVLDPGSANYLLNPAHATFKQIEIGRPQRFPFDGRLTR